MTVVLSNLDPKGRYVGLEGEGIIEVTHGTKGTEQLSGLLVHHPATWKVPEPLHLNRMRCISSRFAGLDVSDATTWRSLANDGSGKINGRLRNCQR